MASQISANWNSANGINASLISNRYFYSQSRESNLWGIKSSPYVVLKPKGNGVVDVYKEMYWSNLGDKSEVPQIFVIEKELQYGTWATQLGNLLTQANNLLGGGSGINNSSVDTFVQLYAAENTGFYYNFPWLLKNGDSIRAIENTWESTQGLGDFLTGASPSMGDNVIGKVLGSAVGAVIGSYTPGFGFEDTKQYSATTQQSITISFPLYNTIDLESAFNHFSFVNLFTFQCLKTRTSLMSYIPPKIYEVDANSIGGVYMAAAVVSNFKVDSIGTTRRMSEWSGFGPQEILIPEAYKVTITFTDLLSQSSNVFAGALGGTKVRVTNADTVLNAGGNFLQTANTELENLGGNLADRTGLTDFLVDKNLVP
jgi:hypothetical protein